MKRTLIAGSFILAAALLVLGGSPAASPSGGGEEGSRDRQEGQRRCPDPGIAEDGPPADEGGPRLQGPPRRGPFARSITGQAFEGRGQGPRTQGRIRQRLQGARGAAGLGHPAQASHRQPEVHPDEVNSLAVTSHRTSASGVGKSIDELNVALEVAPKDSSLHNNSGRLTLPSGARQLHRQPRANPDVQPGLLRDRVRDQPLDESSSAWLRRSGLPPSGSCMRRHCGAGRSESS